MKKNLRIFVISLSLLAFSKVGMSQGTIIISFANKTVTGNTWTFDVVAAGPADYIAPDQNNWQAMNIRMDIALPAGVTILSGTGTGSATYTTGLVGVQTSVPGAPPAGSQEMGLTISRTAQTDLTTTPVTIATFNVVFSGPPDPADIVTPRTTLGTAGSSWTNLSNNPALGTKRAFSQPVTFVLPVNIVSFTGVTTGSTANLAWKTANESNSSYYEVEASTDGSSFSQVGNVASLNSSTGASYKFAYSLGSGVTYFRLKMVDKDGSYAYSTTIAVQFGGLAPSIIASPNPVINLFTVRGLVGKNTINVYNAIGQKMVTVATANTQQAIDASNYASGVYIVNVISESGTTLANLKIVKK